MKSTVLRSITATPPRELPGADNVARGPGAQQRPHRSSGRGRMAGRAVGVGVLVSSLALGVGAGAAQASDGRASGGRAELAALYQHELGRTPDPSGLDTFGTLIDRDCRLGVLTAAYSIATSPEAGAYLNTPDRKVNSVYAGLLERGPDAAGWNAHHDSLLAGRSWNKVVTSVLASPEYQHRLDSICAGAPSSNAVMVPAAANDGWVDQLLDLGAASAFTCVSSKAVPAMAKKIRVGGLPVGQLAGEAGKLTAKYLNAGDSCGEAARYFAAAAYGSYLAQSGEPVYWRAVTSRGPRQWTKLGGCDFHQEIQVGSSPIELRTIEGTAFQLICGG